MKSFTRYSVVSVLIAFLSACAAPQIKEADKDTTGAYSGAWVGNVSKPKSSNANLAGNNRLSCEWEPFQLNLMVANGIITINGTGIESYISTAGDFALNFSDGEATMRMGVASGKNSFLHVFMGNLSGENPTGKYRMELPSVGAGGCLGSIVFSKV